MMVGEGPGGTENETGVPFTGKAGDKLEKILFKIGWCEGIYLTNVVKCRPPNNRVPTIEEQNVCEEWLIKEINILKPQGIICLGRTASEFFLRKTNQACAGTLRGKIFKWNTNVIYCTWHPAALLYSESSFKEAELQYDLATFKTIISTFV